MNIWVIEGSFGSIYSKGERLQSGNLYAMLKHNFTFLEGYMLDFFTAQKYRICPTVEGLYVDIDGVSLFPSTDES